MAAFRSLLCGLLLVSVAFADQTAEQDQVAATYQRTVRRGIDYLIGKGRAGDGSFSRTADPGVTALATTALLRHGRSPHDPVVAKSLKYLESFVRDDGGIYREGTFFRNYETCLSLMCFAAANSNGQYDGLIENADAFIKRLQWDEGESKGKDDFDYGGAGYGKHERPDLSNTQFLIEALRAAGNEENSEAIQRALVFVSRCQNYESVHNSTPFGAKNPDGGFYYTPAAGGSSQAGQSDSGGLRSYGSMTYAGLKSMIFAGVAADDPRVKAAVDWITKHYDLTSNPGMQDAGLYYYYHTLAKSLDAFGQDTLVVKGQISHQWRTELVAELAKRQHADGSWVNLNDRWLEGDPHLVTAYALLALSHCRP